MENVCGFYRIDGTWHFQTNFSVNTFRKKNTEATKCYLATSLTFKSTPLSLQRVCQKNWPCYILIFPILINGRVVAGGLCPPPWRPGPELQKASFVPSAKNKSWSGILGKFQYLLIFLATSPMANAFLREKNPASTSIFWEYVMDLQARHLTCAPFLRVPQVTSIDCIYLWFIRNIIVYLRKPNTEQKCQASHPPPRYMLLVRNS